MTPDALINFLRTLAQGDALRDMADGLEDALQRALTVDKKASVTLEVSVEPMQTRDAGAPPLNWMYRVATKLPAYPTRDTILYRHPSGSLVRYRPDQDALPGFIDNEPHVIVERS